MDIRHIPARRIPFEWERLVGLLRPAIGYDPNVTELDVYGKLINGICNAFTVTEGEAKGLLVAEICDVNGKTCLWASYIAGTVNGRPRAFLALMRGIMAEVEMLARNAGCEEIRIGGRDWSKVFPEYEPVANGSAPNELRKAL
jgi:hypothetical protein